MELVILKHKVIQKCLILLALHLIETQHLIGLPIYLVIIISLGSEDIEILLASGSLESNLIVCLKVGMNIVTSL
jgi:hypothetical protein